MKQSVRTFKNKIKGHNEPVYDDSEAINRKSAHTKFLGLQLRTWTGLAALFTILGVIVGTVVPVVIKGRGQSISAANTAPAVSPPLPASVAPANQSFTNEGLSPTSGPIATAAPLPVFSSPVQAVAPAPISLPSVAPAPSVIDSLPPNSELQITSAAVLDNSTEKPPQGEVFCAINFGYVCYDSPPESCIKGSIQYNSLTKCCDESSVLNGKCRCAGGFGESSGYPNCGEILSESESKYPICRTLGQDNAPAKVNCTTGLDDVEAYCENKLYPGVLCSPTYLRALCINTTSPRYEKLQECCYALSLGCYKEGTKPSRYCYDNFRYIYDRCA